MVSSITGYDITAQNLKVDEYSTLYSGDYTLSGLNVRAYFYPETVSLTGDFLLGDTGVISGGVFDFYNSPTRGFNQFSPIASIESGTFNVSGESGTYHLPAGTYGCNINYSGDTSHTISFYNSDRYVFRQPYIFSSPVDLSVSGVGLLQFQDVVFSDGMIIDNSTTVYISGHYSGEGASINSLTFYKGSGDLVPGTISGSINSVSGYIDLQGDLDIANLTVRQGTFNFNSHDLTTSGDFKSYNTVLSGFNGTTWSITGDMEVNGREGNLVDLRAAAYTVTVSGTGIVNFGNISGMDASAGSQIGCYSSVIN